MSLNLTRSVSQPMCVAVATVLACGYVAFLTTSWGRNRNLRGSVFTGFGCMTLVDELSLS